MISKKTLQVDEQLSSWKNYGKYKKIQIHQTCNTKKKETLFCQNQIIMAQRFSQKVCWQ